MSSGDSDTSEVAANHSNGEQGNEVQQNVASNQGSGSGPVKSKPKEEEEDEDIRFQKSACNIFNLLAMLSSIVHTAFIVYLGIAFTGSQKNERRLGGTEKDKVAVAIIPLFAVMISAVETMILIINFCFFNDYCLYITSLSLVPGQILFYVIYFLMADDINYGKSLTIHCFLLNVELELILLIDRSYHEQKSAHILS